MKDTTISDDSGQDNNAPSGVKVYASLSSLEQDGTQPAIGDSVDLTVSGTVESLHGDVACIVPETVNGEPAPPAPADEAEGPTSEHDRLYSQADNA
jgi:hypothetical protein